MERREYLLAATALAAGIAGCSGEDSQGADDETNPAEDDTESEDDDGDTPASGEEPAGTGTEERVRTVNRLQVAGSVTGEDTDSNEDIERIGLIVKPESGAGDIDLGETTIEYVGPEGYKTLTEKQFTVSAVNDDDTSISTRKVLNGETDTASIRIDLTAIPDLDALGTGESATVMLRTDSGGETEIRLAVPDVITSQTVVLSP